MNFNNRIKEIGSKGYLFGISSSEDIYWFVTGYCFAEKNYTTTSAAIISMQKLQYYIEAKFSIKNLILNWGTFIKSISNNDIASILLFNELYHSSINTLISNELVVENQLLNIKINDNKFEETVKLITPSVNNTLQLGIFLIGYEAACTDYKVNEDKSYNRYIESKDILNKKILKKLELPLHSNWMIQLYARFYPNPNDGVTYFTNELLGDIL